MRLERVVPVFAAAITLTGSAAPAYAFDNRAPEAGPTALVSHPAASVHRSDGSSGLVDLGAGLVAGAAISSLGLAAVTRRSARTTRHPAGVAPGRS